MHEFRRQARCHRSALGILKGASATAFWIWALTAVVSAQQQQAKVFNFGAARSEVTASFGRPDKWLAPIEGKYMNTVEEYSAALSVYNPIWDVYMRETKSNLYEIQVGYRNDSSVSRLRPTQRLGSLDVLVDKPAPAAQLLADFPEAYDICREGCDLYGIPDLTEKYVLAYPSKPTPEQTKLDHLLATDFKSEPSKDEWCVVVKLFLGEQQQRVSRPIDYSGNVVKLKFEPDSLPYELYKSDASSKQQAKKIGTWIPPQQ